MKKKLFLISLALILLTACIMTMSMRRVASSVLQKGSAEELRDLSISEEILYHAQEGAVRNGKLREAYAYLRDPDEGKKLRSQVGYVKIKDGVFEDAITLFVTEPTQELLDELQTISAFENLEIKLGKCSYSFEELLSAEEKLGNWLESAPKSVKNSVQFYLVMPKQERVAVYVKDWSGSDHSAMAKAMGADCPKFFLVEEDLLKGSGTIEFIDRETWQTVKTDPEKWIGETEDTKRIIEEFKEMYYCYGALYPEDDERYLAVYSHMVNYSPTLTLQCSVYDGVYVTRSYRSNPIDHTVNNGIYPNKEWTKTIELTQRALLSFLAPGKNWQVIHSCY